MKYILIISTLPSNRWVRVIIRSHIQCKLKLFLEHGRTTCVGNVKVIVIYWLQILIPVINFYEVTIKTASIP